MSASRPNDQGPREGSALPRNRRSNAAAQERAALVARLRARSDQFSRVSGSPHHVEVERTSDPLRIDHVWMTIEVGSIGRLRASINTLSLKNRSAGFDPRVKIGIVPQPYDVLPPAGIYDAGPCDYSEFESQHPIVYEWREREEIERLITKKTTAAHWVEVWGELYVRNHLGIHEIHCRRASCAVPRDVFGKDGALRFYFGAEKRSELVLFKFCGQDSTG